MEPGISTCFNQKPTKEPGGILLSVVLSMKVELGLGRLSIRSLLREPEVGLRRVPFQGSP